MILTSDEVDFSKEMLLWVRWSLCSDTVRARFLPFGLGGICPFPWVGDVINLHCDRIANRNILRILSPKKFQISLCHKRYFIWGFKGNMKQQPCSSHARMSTQGPPAEFLLSRAGLRSPCGWDASATRRSSGCRQTSFGIFLSRARCVTRGPSFSGRWPQRHSWWRGDGESLTQGPAWPCPLSFTVLPSFSSLPFALLTSGSAADPKVRAVYNKLFYMQG